MKVLSRIKTDLQWRTYLGIGLMVLSALAMILWETTLRSRLAFRSVLVCAEDIEEGRILEAGDIRTAAVTPQSMVPGALKAADAERVIGLAARFPMKKNQQITEDMFWDGIERAERSSFVIPDVWIWSESTLDREGDTAGLYMVDTGELLGRFKISVAPESGRDLELLCTLEEFLNIRDAVMGAGPPCILVVGESR
ncbi:MAG: SAF domain-containing protein [Firmicutes bacterium]|nr:SAF domain-containing protein [Bacillota bacterium]